ncbi:hypothetical protein D3C84_1288360 [compost metagenome]
MKIAFLYFAGNMLPVLKRMPSEAECGPVFSTGFSNSVHERPQPNSGSRKLPW